MNCLRKLISLIVWQCVCVCIFVFDSVFECQTKIWFLLNSVFRSVQEVLSIEICIFSSTIYNGCFKYQNLLFKRFVLNVCIVVDWLYGFYVLFCIKSFLHTKYIFLFCLFLFFLNELQLNMCEGYQVLCTSIVLWLKKNTEIF